MPRYKYETDDGVIVQIRLSEEKKVVAGAEPAAAIDQAGWFMAVNASSRSQTKRRARRFIYTFEEAAGEAGRKLITRWEFPILTPAVFNAAAPATVTYLGNVLQFAGKSAES